MNSNFIIGAIVAFVIGIMLIVIGVKEKNLAAASSGTPQEISLKDLIARGPEGNPNILLKDHVLCDNFVYQTRSNVWSNAWVPMVPRESLAPGQMTGGRPGAVQALMFTINARDQGDLYNRCGQQRVRALVTNKIVTLDSKARDLLQQSYPGTDFSRCLIVQEGREPAGAGKLIAFLGGGAAATLLGLGLAGYTLYRWRADAAPPRRKRKAARIEDDDEETKEEDERPRRKRTRRDDDE